MGTALIAWELGGGRGHLMQLGPIARGLAAKGHTVFAALRHLDRAEEVIGRGVVSLLAAPWAMTPVERQVTPPVTFAHIVHNMGWNDVAQLRGLCEAWRSLYALVEPDVVVFDFAPTGLLAARSMLRSSPPPQPSPLSTGERGNDVEAPRFAGFKTGVIGSGFCVPPDEAGRPPRNLRPWVKAAHAEAKAMVEFEKAMVGRVNEMLAEYGAPPIERVTQVYGEVDEMFLATLPELDHYGVREGVRYWGAVSGNVGSRAMDGDWPLPLTPSPEYRGEGKKVYAYLKNFPALEALLGALEGGEHDTVVVCDGVPAEVRKKFADARHVRFEDRPLDLRRVAREFDLAITNGGHGTTAAMLLAGVPVLLVPIHLEQGMLSRAAARNTGACVEGSHKDGEQLVRALNGMLEPGRFERLRDAARRFARKYDGLSESRQVGKMVARIEELMSERTTGASRCTA